MASSFTIMHIYKFKYEDSDLLKEGGSVVMIVVVYISIKEK